MNSTQTQTNTSCWNCSKVYPMDAAACPLCGCANANADLAQAVAESTEIKQTHTPGKWYAREWTFHSATTVVVDDAAANVTGKRVVAECETEADARLIAACPDMLLALEVIASTLEALEEFENLRYIASSAIAKAKGGAQ